MLLPNCPLLWITLFSTALATTTAQTDLAAPDRFVPAEPISAKELFGQTIRDSQFRSPAEEMAGFHLPDGFQIDLIASEPTISKPMNMAFDARGRLWITQTTQYPFPAKEGEKGTDGIVVLEDKDNNGSFETSRVFADGLNIPIGLLPYGDGVLCFSIPNILFLRDTDKDGVCDQREVVIGPFDTTRDTHGMVNSLRMGSDGWVYACHGFNNQSTVQGKDGHAISMTSGNVFRFRPDGSRVELYTQGQVNPFGMAQDRWGFWYAADCHSKPISQLIRGGCYPSFGRPDDGLGFVPPMMEHLHGSTAISGLAHSKDSHFPKAFEDNFFSGNVMTCRINRNLLTYRGATAKANAMPDLLTSDDPWFRPVDLQFGPDGCLYVADFYNKVIGHYEVPLNHPDRDRTSGRIWRIRWTGSGETIQRVSGPTISDPESLFAGCVVDGAPVGTDGGLMARAVMLSKGNDTLSAMRAYHLYERSASSDDEPISLLQQIAREEVVNDAILHQSILISVRDGLVRSRKRDAAAYGSTLTELISERALEMATKPASFSMDAPYARALTRILLSLKDRHATAALIALSEKQMRTANAPGQPDRVLMETLQSISEVIDESNMDRFLALLDATTNDADARGEQLLRIAKRQMQQQGKVLDSLAQRCRQMVGEIAGQWQSESPMNHWAGQSTKKEDRKDWPTEKRTIASGNAGDATQRLFFSSFPLGESYTGTWSTSPFVANGTLDFFLVGHNGLPSKPDSANNYACLVKLDESGNVVEELYRAMPPRSDIGKRVQWDLSSHQGATVQIRVVDGDATDSYAWIGIGESSRQGLNPSTARDRWERVLSLVALCGFPNNADGLDKTMKLLRSDQADWTSRYRLHRLNNQGLHAEAVELVDFAVENHWNDLLKRIGVDTTAPPAWSWKLEPDRLLQLGDAICKRCSYKDQERLVVRLSKQRSSHGLIATLCERGSLSRDALRALPNGWWEGLTAETKTRMEALRPDASASNRLQVVERKAAAIEKMAVDMKVGAKQFADRCAACHKLGDQGKVIGPQLEGVGARGILRLCEDILWPDRNVDEAFRMTIMVLDGGESANGLVSDRTSESLMLTEQSGKQRRILIRDIEQEKASKLSLMPGNFDELMTDSEFASLIGYLRASASRPQ